MGKKAMQILADNLERNCAPGYRFEKIVDLGLRAGVGKSTIGRIKNGQTATGIDNVEAIAAAYGLQAWQFLVPDLDVKQPPKLVDDGLGHDELELLAYFSRMTMPEKMGLLATAKAIVEVRHEVEPSKSSTKA